MAEPTFLQAALSPQVLPRAIRVALIVGTLLMLINYGDKLWAMSLSSEDMLKITLTYIVPYGVSTWSAVQAIVSRGKDET